VDETQRRWEERYAAGADSPDGARPHPEVLALLDRTAGERAGRTPTALDLGAGAGRHTVALAAAGFDPTAVDWAPSAVRIAERALAERGLPGRALVADLRTWDPAQEQRSGPDVVPERFDLVLAVHLQDDVGLPDRTAGWLVPGGRLLWISHAPGSADGPPAAVPRPSLAEIAGTLAGTDLELLRAEEVATTPTTLDVVVEARRPG
jgi:SAM-dependent methyltransferase